MGPGPIHSAAVDWPKQVPERALHEPDLLHRIPTFSTAFSTDLHATKCPLQWRLSATTQPGTKHERSFPVTKRSLRGKAARLRVPGRKSLTGRPVRRIFVSRVTRDPPAPTPGSPGRCRTPGGVRSSAEDPAALRDRDSEGREKAGASAPTRSKPPGGGARDERGPSRREKDPWRGQNPKGGTSPTHRFAGEAATDSHDQQSPEGGREPRAARVAGFIRANAKREGRPTRRRSWP